MRYHRCRPEENASLDRLPKLQIGAEPSTRVLADLDPDKTLRPAGASAVVTFTDWPLAPGQKAEGTLEVDPDAVVAEIDERNSRPISLECPGR